MIVESFAQMSVMAILVATAAYYLLGAVWFSPLFGKAWDRAIGHTRDDDGGFSLSYYLVPLASSALVTLAMAVLLAAVRPPRLVDGLALGLVVGCGVAAAVSVNNALTPHTPHPFRHGFITGGYHLVGIVGVTAILASMSS